MGNQKAQGRSDQDPHADKPAGNRPAQNARIATPGSVSEGLPRAGEAADFLGLNQELGAAPPPAPAPAHGAPAPRVAPPSLSAPALSSPALSSPALSSPALGRQDASHSVAPGSAAPTVAHAAPNVAAEANASWLFQRQEPETVVVPPAVEPEPVEVAEPAPEIAYQEPEPPTRRMKPVLIAAGGAALLAMIGFATWSAFRASKSNSDGGGAPDVVAGTAVPKGPELVEPTATPSRYPGRRSTNGGSSSTGATESRAALVPTQPEPTNAWNDAASSATATFDVASTDDAQHAATEVGNDAVATGEPAPTEWLDGASGSGFDGSDAFVGSESDGMSGSSHADPTHASSDPFAEPATEGLGDEDGAHEDASFEDEVPEFDPNLRSDTSAGAALVPAAGELAIGTPATGTPALPAEPTREPKLESESTTPFDPVPPSELDATDSSELPAPGAATPAGEVHSESDVNGAPVDESLGSAPASETTAPTVETTLAETPTHDAALRAPAAGQSAAIVTPPDAAEPSPSGTAGPAGPAGPAGAAESAESAESTHAPRLEANEHTAPVATPDATSSPSAPQDSRPNISGSPISAESGTPVGVVPIVGAPTAPVDERGASSIAPQQDKSSDVAKPENTPTTKPVGTSSVTNSGTTPVADVPVVKQVDGAAPTSAPGAPAVQKSTDAGGLRVANSKDLSGVWTDTTIPFDAIGGAKRLLTPSVGRVRVHLVEKQMLEGLLYSVGEKQVTLSTDLGRIGIAADRVQKIERIEVAKVDPAKDPAASEQRIKTPGGVIFGKVVSTEGGQTIVQTKEGSRVTFASKDIQILSGSKVGIKP
ncbi:MAG: hypothetical protein L6Q99_21115 [Planctomycetes bacterium]|nr:hypothetical protein [Planctomycetota bacterium]